MAKPKVSETEFVRLCCSLPSIRKIAEHLDINIRAVQRRMDRLKDKYGDLRPKGFYPEQVEYYGGQTEKLDFKGTMVIFSDAHFWPDHYHPQSPAYTILLQILEEIKPDIILDNGDSFDGYSISRHPPHGWHDGPSVAEELEAVKYYKSRIANASPKSQLYWVWGNHDARYDSRLRQHAAEFKGVEGFALVDHFKDWKFCQSLEVNGNFKATHKWRGGEHAGYNEALRSGISYCTGHDHMLYVRPYTDMTGTRFGMKSGTLCDPQGPQFFYRGGNESNWQSGFLIVHFDEDIHAEAILVNGNKARYGGKLYESTTS